MCEHLREFEAELIARGIPVTFRGQAWSHNCREWVYFTCYIDLAAVRARLNFPPCVVDHINDDPKRGREQGFECSEHHDAVMGMPDPSRRYPTIR
jgi:hypothetical protein